MPDPLKAADDLARTALDIVNSFTSAGDGSFIKDDLTRVEYESLKAAEENYREARLAAVVPDENDGGS